MPKIGVEDWKLKMKVTKNKDKKFWPWKDSSTQKIGVEDRYVGGSQKGSFLNLWK